VLHHCIPHTPIYPLDMLLLGLYYHLPLRLQLFWRVA